MKYIFRGRVVLDYDPETKELTAPVDPDTGIPEMNMCKFVLEDYDLMVDFLKAAQYHKADLCPDGHVLEDIEVD